jgi:hypothetical protein
VPAPRAVAPAAKAARPAPAVTGSPVDPKHENQYVPSPTELFWRQPVAPVSKAAGAAPVGTGVQLP